MAYGICLLGLSWAIGVPSSEITNKGTVSCSCFCHSDHNAGLLSSIRSLQCFCTAIPSSDDSQDGTKRSKRSCNTIDYGDEGTIPRQWRSGSLPFPELIYLLQAWEWSEGREGESLRDWINKWTMTRSYMIIWHWPIASAATCPGSQTTTSTAASPKWSGLGQWLTDRGAEFQPSQRSWKPSCHHMFWDSVPWVNPSVTCALKVWTFTTFWTLQSCLAILKTDIYVYIIPVNINWRKERLLPPHNDYQLDQNSHSHTDTYASTMPYSLPYGSE